MSYQIYKIVHFVGLFMVLLAVGAQIFHGMNSGSKQHQAKKWLGMHSGLGLLFLLVGGFGMLAKLKIGFPGWVVGKIAVWLALGFVGAVAIRRPQFSKTIWMMSLLVLGFATWLAVMKPFS